MIKFKFDILFQQIIKELTQQDLAIINKYKSQRNKDLSFGPIFKQERTYFSIQHINQIPLEVPQQLTNYLQQNGFKINDYKQGIATDKYRRIVKIGKVLTKLDNKDLIKSFNERLKANIKTINKDNLSLCFTWNAEDIAKMSTERNWTSCMDIHTGAFHETPLLQIKYGGMCVYLIDKSDENIQNPYARIAIKRLQNQQDKTFIFVSQQRIYGDWGLAEQVNMGKQVDQILNKSNDITSKNTFKFSRNSDDLSYSDQRLTTQYNKKVLNQNLNNVNGRNIFEVIWTTKLPINILENLITKFDLTNQDTDIYFNISNSEFFQDIMDDYNQINVDKSYLPETEELSSQEAFIMLWYAIAKKQDLTLQFIKKYQKYLNWNILSKYQNYDLLFNLELKDKVNFSLIFSRTNLPLKYFNLLDKENYKYVDWNSVYENKKIPLNVILSKLKEPNWTQILINRQIPEHTLKQYLIQIKEQDAIHILLAYQHLSYEFITKYIKEYDWSLTIVNQFIMNNIYPKHTDLFNKYNFNISKIQNIKFEYGYDETLFVLPEQFLLDKYDTLKSIFNKILLYWLVGESKAEITKTVIYKYMPVIDWYGTFRDELIRKDNAKLSELIPCIYTSEFFNTVKQYCKPIALELLQKLKKKFKTK